MPADGMPPVPPSPTMPREPDDSRRKPIHAAGVLIVHGDEAVAGTLQAGLAECGMTDIRRAANVVDGLAAIDGRPPAGAVVGLPLAEALSFREGLVAAGLDAVPIVLMLPDGPAGNRHAGSGAGGDGGGAEAIGFDAVLPQTLPPRLLYRRLGSLMQRARRIARRHGGQGAG